MTKNEFLSSQIITYMGNKRKLLPYIEDEVEQIISTLGNKKIYIGDGFSGSGIVSRLLKTKADYLYTNDIAGYSHTLNSCYLSNPSNTCINKIHDFIDTANQLAREHESNSFEPWLSKHWAPSNNHITANDRVYYTYNNGRIIDVIRNYIDTIPNKYKCFLLAPLLVESSIHNNTNGQFSAYYKHNNIGAYGGKKSIDINRITQDIKLPYPIFDINKCNVICSQKDVIQWITDIPNKLDIVYYDPPYNKHPYNIYYFLLDIINNWDKTIDIPNTNRGQPLNWTPSNYNSTKYAKKAMEDLIINTNASYIILSYNSGGIISIDELDNLLNRLCSNVKKIPIIHKTYNRLKGISNYKRVQDYKDVKEYLFVIKK